MSSSRPAERHEEVLHGGTANRGLIVRVGDTVRRPRRATSPAAAALLAHLADVGFDGAPRHLGTDEEGRDVLSYVPGQTVTPPYPPWALTDAALESVASLLRRYHAAVAGLETAGLPWAGPVPPEWRGPLVTHNDPNLDNIVFRDGAAVALIDFDLAAPGSRVWEVAAAARFWAPLRADTDVDDPRRGRTLARLRLLADTYGLEPGERERLPAAVLANHDWLYGIVRSAAEGGHEAFGHYWQGGGGARAARTRRWYESNLDVLAAALR